MSVPASFMIVILIWSTTPLAIKWSGEGTGFMLAVSLRMLIGTVLCLLLLKLFRLPLYWHKKARRVYMASAVGIFGAMSSVYWGAQFIPSGLISVIFGLTPIATGIFAAVFLKEKSLGSTKIVGMLFGFAGLYFVFGVGLKLGDNALYGIAAILLSMTLHSISTVAVKALATDLPALSVTSGGLLFSLPLYLLSWLLLDGSIPDAIPTQAISAIVYLGIFGSVIGFVLFFYVLKHVPASRVGLIPLVTPVMALFLGYFLNDEVITRDTYLGAVMILSGLLIYQFGNSVIKLFSGKKVTEIL